MSRLRKLISTIWRIGINPWLWKIYAGVGWLPRKRLRSKWPPQQIFFAYPYFSVGDSVLAVSLLERVHMMWPDAAIDVAMGGPMAEVAAALPFIRRVDRMTQPTIKSTTARSYLAAAAMLRQFRRSPAAVIYYDLAIAPRWSPLDGFLSVYQVYLTGAPVRCGYSYKAYGGMADTDCLLTHIGMGGEGEHESQRYTQLLARCGLEPKSMREYDREEGIPVLKSLADIRAKTRGASVGGMSTNYLVLSPGATNGRRMWPVKRFAQIARWAQQEGWAVVAIGGAQDLALCDELAAQVAGVQSFAGKTGGLEMLDLIAGARLFVGNDSGPAHIAGAVGVPTVVISPFPTSFHGEHVNAPSRFRPTGRLVRVVQPESSTTPCTGACEENAAHCILAVQPAQVIAIAKELISNP